MLVVFHLRTSAGSDHVLNHQQGTAGIGDAENTVLTFRHGERTKIIVRPVDGHLRNRLVLLFIATCNLPYIKFLYLRIQNRIAYYLHLIVLIEQEGLEHHVIWETIQSVKIVLFIETNGINEITLTSQKP